MHIKTYGRTDLADFFDIGDFADEVWDHTPALVFLAEDDGVRVRVVDRKRDLLAYPDDTPVMQQLARQVAVRFLPLHGRPGAAGRRNPTRGTTVTIIDPNTDPRDELPHVDSALHLDDCVVLCTNDGHGDEPPLDRCPEDQRHSCYPACPFSGLTYAQFHERE